MRFDVVRMRESRRKFREPDTKEITDRPKQSRASFGGDEEYVERADEWLASPESEEMRETWTGPQSGTKSGLMRRLIRRAMTRLRS